MYMAVPHLGFGWIDINNINMIDLQLLFARLPLSIAKRRSSDVSSPDIILAICTKYRTVLYMYI
jgi:hypothetical protein